ncbi:MAG: hypothetical protein LUH10_18550 [Tannerellaceae bacterium]|nr:hypothetical protein [Tannerellaceae bacterium]
MSENQSLPPGAGQGASPAPGIHCPRCETFIPVTINGLINGTSFFCSRCMLRITPDTRQSSKAIDILRKVNEAQQRVEESQHFER